MMKPTPTTCIETESGIPNSEHAIGISSSEPPVTPEVPHAASTERKDRDHRCRERNLNAEGVSRREGHNRDRDGRAVHVDRRAERDRHGVHIPVKPELFT